MSLDMETNRHTCSLGGGVIGASWTSLFLAGAKSVAVFDPAPQIERQVRDYIATAWPSLEELGLVVDGADPDAVTFHADARAAVDGAGFIQESVPSGSRSNTSSTATSRTHSSRRRSSPRPHRGSPSPRCRAAGAYPAGSCSGIPSTRRI
jgi:hypothetical protein